MPSHLKPSSSVDLTISKHAMTGSARLTAKGSVRKISDLSKRATSLSTPKLNGISADSSSGQNATILTGPQHDQRFLKQDPDRYNYSPLADHGTSFRLLKLHPGTKNDHLVCELIQHDINQCPQYDAVSYTWADASGDTTPSSTIAISGSNTVTKVPITKNCELALKRFRFPSLSRLLWLDSICINQQNKQEQSAQVQMMASIFANAWKVLIYLGDGSEFNPPLQITKVFQLILGSICFDSRGICQMTDDHSHRCTTIETLLSTPSSEPQTQSVIEDLRKLLTLPWFGRVWVLQEAIMAKAATVYYGQNTPSLEWAYLKPVNFRAPKLSAKRLTASTLLPPVLRLAKVIKDNSNDLATLISLTSPCHASDPRDKVYALLGLYDCQTNPQLAPNYTQTADQVFLDTALHCILNNQSLKILSLARSSSTPSWLPDLFTPRNSPTLADLVEAWPQEFHRRHKYLPAWSPKMSARFENSWIEYEDSHQSLKLLGRRVDNITNIMSLEGRVFLDFEKQMTELHNMLDPGDDGEVANAGNPWTLEPCSNLNSHTEPDSIPYHRSFIVLFGSSDILEDEFETRQRCRISLDERDPESCRHMYKELFWLMEHARPNRLLIRGENFIGIGPEESKPGDLVYALKGASTLFVLRSQPNGYYTLIGECLVHLPLDRDCVCSTCGLELEAECPCEFSCPSEPAKMWRTEWESQGEEFVRLK